MHAKERFVSTVIALAAIALGCAAGAASPDVYSFSRAEPARVETRVVAQVPTTNFDYFPRT